MDSEPNFKKELCELEMVADGLKGSATECNDTANMAIKIEVKEEPCWDDVPTAEINQQSELNSGFFHVLLVNKKEADSDNDADDLPSSKFPRLFTEAVNQDDSDTCTSLTYPGLQGNCGTEETTSDFKTSIVYTQNVKKEFSTRQYNCNPAQECDNYSKNFLSASEVLLDEEKQLIKCEICEKIFKDKSYLKRHMYNHSGVKPYKCDSCEKSFNLKSNLKRHTMVHSGIKPYKCNSCEKSFTQNTLLKTHMLWHSGTKPYSCDICNKTFIRKSNLHTHTLSHSEKNRYECDICGKSFARKQSLTRHNLHHSNTKSYKCDKCGKGFNQKSHLKEHSLCHSVEKAYKCDNCGRSFKRKSSLRTHSLFHLGRKPYKCDICEKRFMKKTHLESHSVCHLRTQPTMSQL